MNLNAKVKTSVITLHSVRNYGSVLQAYATSELLKEAGGDPFFVDYRRQCDLYPVESWLSDSPSWSKNRLTAVLFRCIKMPSAKKQKQIFKAFLEKHLPLTRQYNSLESLISDPPIALIYCTGSDQVFNTYWNGKLDLAYFQVWAPNNAYRFSFASSFGRDTLETWEKQEAAKLLENFQHLSFREDSALSLIPANSNICLPDPVLILSPDIWEQLAEPIKLPEKFILIYQLTHTKKLDTVAQSLSHKTGLPLLRISTFYDQLRYPGHLICCPTPQQFLYIFSKASCVLTDSFHGTSFSIIFRKSFSVFLPERFPCRIQNLLNMLNLTSHISCEDIFQQKTNWSEINQILDEKRNQAQSYLNQVFGEAGKYSNCTLHSLF